MSTEVKTASRCLCCGKNAPLRCAKCHGTYCSLACQKTHWPTHKAHCKTLSTLRAKGITWDVSAELAALLADPVAEPYDGPKGRGLRATRDIPAGSCVGYIVGKEVGGDGGVNSFPEYVYLWVDVVGDVASNRVLPEEVNASLMNDAMRPEVYDALVTQGPLKFIQNYEINLKAVAIVLDKTHQPPGAKWGAYRARATKDVPAGAPLETFYGPGYWLNMLASGVLPGTTFKAAWEANHVIARGCPEFHNALVLEALGRPPANAGESGHILASSELGGVPVWLRFERVEALYGGVPGKSYFPTNPDAVKDGATNYILAPWSKGLRKVTATGAPQEGISAAIFYAALIGTTLQARGLVRQLLANPQAADRPAAVQMITTALTEIIDSIDIGVPPAALAKLIVLAPDKVDGLVKAWLEKGSIPH